MADPALGAPVLILLPQLPLFPVVGNAFFSVKWALSTPNTTLQAPVMPRLAHPHTSPVCLSLQSNSISSTGVTALTAALCYNRGLLSLK